MKIINTKDANFKSEFDAILARANSDIKGVSTIVMNIIEEIVQEGNTALKRHISKFDKDYGRGTYGCKERVTYREV